MNLAALIGVIKPFLPLGADAAHQAVERWVTIPKTQRERLYTGMDAEDKAEAERLQRVMADAVSDYTVFVASRGAIPADEEPV